MYFVWDENKRESNLAKHGLDFADAAEILAGPVYYQLDDRKEERWKIYGRLRDKTVVLIVIERETTIRIISMRLSTKREHKRFICELEKDINI